MQSNERPECRICFECDAGEPLIEPCKCSGSMKYVHKSCLQKWIYHKGDSVCNVCKETCRIERNDRQVIASFLLESDLVTTLTTFFICLVLLHISVCYDIKPNTIAVVFFMIVFGIHYIQYFFGHEEINMEGMFETITFYSTRRHSDSYGCFGVICMCMWFMVDRAKYKILSPYV